MSKVTMKGFITSVNPVATAQDQKTKYVNIHFVQPPYVDEFGEQKGKESEFKVGVFNDKITKLLKPEWIGRDHVKKGDVDGRIKCEIEVYINGRYTPAKDGSKEFYNVDLNLAKITVL